MLFNRHVTFYFYTPPLIFSNKLLFLNPAHEFLVGIFTTNIKWCHLTALNMPLDYRKLNIYDLAHQFVLDVYKATEAFPESEHKNLSSQLRRAAVSIPLNIAEGSSRRSKKEFLNFLNYGFGSGKEIEVLLVLSKDLGFLTSKDFADLSKQLDHLMSKMFLFIRSVERRIPGTKYYYTNGFKRDSSNL